MVFDEFWWILMDFDGFWWVLMGFDEFWWVLMGFDGFWWILMNFDGFWWVLMGFDGFRWGLMGEAQVFQYSVSIFQTNIQPVGHTVSSFPQKIFWHSTVWWCRYFSILLEDRNIPQIFVPASMTGKWQPLDVTVNRVFKAYYGAEYHKRRTAHKDVPKSRYLKIPGREEFIDMVFVAQSKIELNYLLF